MNRGYTKLFASIVTSSLWSEDSDTRVVWVTMLALADQYGEVQASVPGLARAANVTLAKCQEALKKFEEPDSFSRTPDNEGRRISVIQGGWTLLNYEQYREKMSLDERREYKRVKESERRERLKERGHGVDNHGHGVDKIRHTHTQTQTNTKTQSTEEDASLGSLPQNVPVPPEVIVPVQKPASPVGVSAEEIWQAYPLKKAKMKGVEAIQKQLKNHDGEFLLNKTKQFSDIRGGDVYSFPTVPHASTWFNQSRFLEDSEGWKARGNGNHKPSGEDRQRVEHLKCKTLVTTPMNPLTATT